MTDIGRIDMSATTIGETTDIREMIGTEGGGKRFVTFSQCLVDVG